MRVRWMNKKLAAISIKISIDTHFTQIKFIRQIRTFPYLVCYMHRANSCVNICAHQYANAQISGTIFVQMNSIQQISNHINRLPVDWIQIKVRIIWQMLKNWMTKLLSLTLSSSSSSALRRVTIEKWQYTLISFQNGIIDATFAKSLVLLCVAVDLRIEATLFARFFRLTNAMLESW